MGLNLNLSEHEYCYEQWTWTRIDYMIIVPFPPDPSLLTRSEDFDEDKQVRIACMISVHLPFKYALPEDQEACVLWFGWIRILLTDDGVSWIFHPAPVKAMGLGRRSTQCDTKKDNPFYCLTSKKAIVFILGSREIILFNLTTTILFKRRKRLSLQVWARSSFSSWNPSSFSTALSKRTRQLFSIRDHSKKTLYFSVRKSSLKYRAGGAVRSPASLA